MAHRHGDPTPQRCVFLVAVLPECIIDGKDASGFFSVEGTSLSSVAVESCFDDEPSHGMLHPPRPQDVPALPERDAEGYDGPRLVGTIGIGGMGWSVYGGSGPPVTMKTWGQRPGGATTLHRDSSGRIRQRGVGPLRSALRAS